MFTIDDYRKQSQFNGNCQDGGFGCRIADVWDVKRSLNDEIDDANEHSMEAEDDHSADGDIDNDLGSESVCATPKVDDGEDWEETNNEIEGDVDKDVALVDMPIEKDEAKGKGGDANEEIFFEVSSCQIAGLALYVS